MPSAAIAALIPVSEVYEQYYERFRHAVQQRNCRRLARYHLSAMRQVAEDLCQETFQSAYCWMRNFWQAHHETPSPQVFERVLKTIEINEYRTHLKRAKYAICPASAMDESGESETSLESRLQSPCASPEEELLWKEYEERIEQCLKKLKATERSALVYKLLGYSDKDVAELLGEPQKKVMYSIIPLARRKLRKFMMSYFNDQK